MILRKEDPPIVQLSTPPPDGSSRASTVFSDCDADDEDAMSEDLTDSRPMSFSQTSLQPVGPYCPRIPTLQEILTNVASPPYTLAAFTAHLSQNHCLENLEFIKDADRYRKRFLAMEHEFTTSPSVTDSPECRDLRKLWIRLLDAYIRPNAPREVNLPANVRDNLVAMPNEAVPPSPHTLDPAVERIIDLMNDSILLGFISEHSPPMPIGQLHEGHDPPSERHMRASPDAARTRSRSRRRPSPVGDILASVHHAASNRHVSHTSHGKLSMHINSSGSGEAQLTDDTGSSASPSNSPMTPPTTPPSSDLGGTSPRTRNDNTWRKMMGRLQTKKKPGAGGSRSQDRMEE